MGAINAGLTPLFGIELDPKIAEVANYNLGQHIKVANLLDCDPVDFERVDVLHASPPCTRASVANNSAEVNEDGLKESPLDIALADKVIEFINVLQPSIVTIENVYAYRLFQSWRGGRKTKGIQQALYDAGYWLHIDHVNAADYGGEILCPLHDLECTISNALIVGRLSNRDFPKGIAPDIAASVATMKSDDQAHHLAWDAVAHLVRVTRQDIAENAVRQKMEKIAHILKKMRILDGKAGDILTTADMFASESTENIDVNIVWLLNKCLDAPLLKTRWSTIAMRTRLTTVLKILECIRATPTICGIIMPKIEKMVCPLCKRTSVPQTRKRMIVRAIRGGFVPYLPQPEPWIGWYQTVEDLIPSLPESQFAPWQLARLPEELRTMLVTSQYDKPSNCEDRKAQQIDSDKPPATVTSSNHGDWRAFIVEGSAAGEDNKFTMPVRMNNEPIFTMRASQNNPRAFIADCQNAGAPSPDRERGLTIRQADEPMFTLTASMNIKRPTRAHVEHGRVVSMTPRCLARFQSFPDTYQLSGNRTLDSRGIGNAVAPLMYQKVINGLVNA